MFNFNTETGKPIHLDGSKEPSFYIDAGDITFIEKMHDLYSNLKEYLKRSNDKKELVLDENGVPANSKEFIDEMKKEYDMILSNIDELLGDGVSQKIFKGRYNQELLSNFISFLAEVVDAERIKYTGKYLKKNESKGVL